MQPVVFAAVRAYRQTDPAPSTRFARRHAAPHLETEFAFYPPALIAEVFSGFIFVADRPCGAGLSTDLAFFAELPHADVNGFVHRHGDVRGDDTQPGVAAQLGG